MLYTLRNDFHGTIATVRATPIRVRLANPATAIEAGETWIELSASQASRARKKLCGMSDCSCSGVLGTRGRQCVTVRVIGDNGAVIAELPRGLR